MAKNKSNEAAIGVYVAIGAGVGAALGVVLDNIAMGVGLGVAAGVIIGVLVTSQNKNRQQAGGQSEDENNENA